MERIYLELKIKKKDIDSSATDKMKPISINVTLDVFFPGLQGHDIFFAGGTAKKLSDSIQIGGCLNTLRNGFGEIIINIKIKVIKKYNIRHEMEYYVILGQVQEDLVKSC